MRKIKTNIYRPTALTGNIDKHYIPVLQDLRKAIYNDRMLSRLADSGNIVIHSSLGYPVAKYKNISISIGIEPLNPMIRQDLTLGYIVVVRNGKVSQEINGLLNRSLPKAISTFKEHINECESVKSKMR
ncbi:hypothetical protein BTW28_00780 [Citrobacter freundii]|uniref:hypothetical protein n=1 Tax=Citrobacter TaxID=544 RepID=UPI000947388A|nr:MULTISPECIES: hypothetical protein [Citrobacter]APR29621.1 hypothetical protein BTW28_00780 [Citrobacter freundii]MBJ8398765.1 hypothetical protein [Citrobacter youngae]MBJ9600994.1 hypothetical protein [Citrobacter sp. FDAARGOS_156]QDK85567.1 hypothetical protein FEO47_08765 [Citrobacter amalonaticus]GIZ21295.1 hypothetical protein TUM12147_46310 [Citrobacter europaeus]